MGRFTYSPNTVDLLFMKGLMEAGKVRSVIDKVYPLSEAAEAFRYLGKGHGGGEWSFEWHDSRAHAERAVDHKGAAYLIRVWSEWSPPHGGVTPRTCHRDGR